MIVCAAVHRSSRVKTDLHAIQGNGQGLKEPVDLVPGKSY